MILIWTYFIAGSFCKRIGHKFWKPRTPSPESIIKHVCKAFFKQHNQSWGIFFSSWLFDNLDSLCRSLNFYCLHVSTEHVWFIYHLSIILFSKSISHIRTVIELSFIELSSLGHLSSHNVSEQILLIDHERKNTCIHGGYDITNSTLYNLSHSESFSDNSNMWLSCIYFSRFCIVNAS